MSKPPDQSRPTILIVDDETSIRSVLATRLGMVGYEVLTAGDGETALDIFHNSAPDLVILDVMLPKGDGYSVCKAIRSVSDAPIIMVTALANLADRITGLELGADDYIVKPFSVKELEARISSILRRFQPSPRSALTSPKVMCVRELQINDDKRQVYKGEQLICLTEIEFKLLKLLAHRSGAVVSRDILLEEIWGYRPRDFFDTRVIDVHVSRLRNKIETDPKNPEYILTVRGEGYTLLDGDSEDE
ncbi:MAG: response regulator [Leptolyngbyaceae cyanobacterium MO_188.B28]|nr:response regulator [Leptolyngbyaceae cyanobacterium MO_188.B28]